MSTGVKETGNNRRKRNNLFRCTLVRERVMAVRTNTYMSCTKILLSIPSHPWNDGGAGYVYNEYH